MQKNIKLKPDVIEVDQDESANNYLVECPTCAFVWSLHVAFTDKRSVSIIMPKCGNCHQLFDWDA